MLETSLGSPSRQPERGGGIRFDSTEIFETLRDFGFVREVGALSQEDYEAISKRSTVIQAHHPVSEELATSLAYIDRMILKEKGNQTAEAELVSLIDGTLVEMLVLNSHLAKDEEFINSVVKTAAVRYHAGEYTTYSDALFASLRDREAAITHSSIAGEIDGEGNVLLKPNDPVPTKISF